MVEPYRPFSRVDLAGARYHLRRGSSDAEADVVDLDWNLSRLRARAEQRGDYASVPLTITDSDMGHRLQDSIWWNDQAAPLIDLSEYNRKTLMLMGRVP